MGVTETEDETVEMLTDKIYNTLIWFFNGSVYGKTTEGKRHKFDIYSNIDKVIRKPAGVDGGNDEDDSK